MGTLTFSLVKALLALTTLTLAHLTAAQIIPQVASNAFPACGLNCTSLLDAQSECVPPAVPVTDQAVYEACFCSSPMLLTLEVTPDGSCDTSCTVASDRIEVSAWYIEFCAAANDTASTPSSKMTSSASKTSMTTARTSTLGTKTSSAASSSSDATAAGLSTGAKAGIGVGVALGVLAAVVAIVAFLMFRRHRKGRIPGKKPSQKRFDKSELDTSTAEIPRTHSRAELEGDEPQLARIPREPPGESQLPIVSNEKERVYEI